MARGFSILKMQSMRADAGVQAADSTTPGTGGAILAVPPVTMWLSSATRTGTVGTFTGNMAGGAGGVIALMSQQGLGTAQGSSTIRVGSEDVQRAA